MDGEILSDNGTTQTIKKKPAVEEIYLEGGHFYLFDALWQHTIMASSPVFVCLHKLIYISEQSYEPFFGRDFMLI